MICVKIGTGYLHVMPLSTELCEIDVMKPALHLTASIKMYLFYVFRPIAIKFGTEDVTAMFVKIRAVSHVTYGCK
jgi:hypothetical protein